LVVSGVMEMGTTDAALLLVSLKLPEKS